MQLDPEELSYTRQIDCEELPDCPRVSTMPCERIKEQKIRDVTLE